MKIKTIITAALLLFVGVSVAYLIIDESIRRPEVEPQEAVSVKSEVGSGLDHEVIAYYFHGASRCQTCLKIEAYSREALEIHFPKELKSGTLKWRAVNVESPENEHFVSDFKLTNKSIVIVNVLKGKSVEHKNLQRVWELVRDKNAFYDYVHAETRAYLEKGE